MGVHISLTCFTGSLTIGMRLGWLGFKWISLRFTYLPLASQPSCQDFVCNAMQSYFSQTPDVAPTDEGVASIMSLLVI